LYCDEAASMKNVITLISSKISLNDRLSKWFIKGGFVLHWGWFIFLSMALTTVCSYFIPDPVSYNSYQATLQVQVRIDTGTSIQGIKTVTFFANLLLSPGVLDLALTRLHSYPQFKKYLLVDLEDRLVTAIVIKDTNIIQLSGYGGTSRDATLIVNAVYNALLQKIQKDRASVIDGISARLNTELAQVQADMLQTATVLEQLKETNQTTSSQYILFANQYSAQKQRLQEINGALTTLKQEGYDDLLFVTSSKPIITTLPAARSTKTDRLALSPFIGLMIGLGGALVASRFSTRLPLRGKQRDAVLPHIATAVPLLRISRDQQLQSLLTNASKLVPLLRRLRYQALENEQQLQVITVTSPKIGEGKSTIAICLAAAAAQSGLNTILVDANPRRPLLHACFQVSGEDGLLNTIRSLGWGTIGSLPLQPTSMSKLTVLPIGHMHTKLTDLREEPFRVDGLQPFLERLRQQADLIVCDGSSLLCDADISALIGFSDAVLLVVDAQIGQRTTVLEAKAHFAEMSVSPTLILNRAVSEPSV
jgi:Mrp family chromosome partitioning ATPase